MNSSHLIDFIQRYLVRYPNDLSAQKTFDFLRNNNLFWQRENLKGHVTASAWVLSLDRSQALLTHHAGLDMWFQLGGHIESDDYSIWNAAKREVFEESGIMPLEIDETQLFDIDVHLIPESKKGIPAHYHYDLRVLMYADSLQTIRYDSAESHDVQWVSIEQIQSKTKEESVLRMVRKTKELSLLD